MGPRAVTIGERMVLMPRTISTEGGLGCAKAVRGSWKSRGRDEVGDIDLEKWSRKMPKKHFTGSQ